MLTEKARCLRLGLFRLLLGGYLTWQSLPYLDRSFVEALPKTLTQFADTQPIYMMKWLSSSILVPWSADYGSLLPVLQFLCGIALTVGFLTPMCATAMIAYGLFTFFLWGHMSPQGSACSVLIILLGILVWAAELGHCFGLDQVIFRTKQPASAKKATVKKPGFKNKKQQQVAEVLNRSIKQAKTKVPAGYDNKHPFDEPEDDDEEEENWDD
jgi:hypothetical protein